MQHYKSDRQEINHDINTVYSKLSNPDVLRQQLEKNADNLPPEAKENLSKVQFTGEGISIESPMGPMLLSVAESVEPTRVVYAAANMPVNFNLTIELEAIDEARTAAVAQINIDLPFMLRAVVGGQLGDAARQLGNMLAVLPYDTL